MILIVFLLISCLNGIYKSNSPLENGTIRKEQLKNKDENILIISSNNKIVKSHITGTIYSVIDVGDEKAVSIQIEKCFYSFSGLDSVFVLKGLSIKIGDTLGIAKKNEEQFQIILKKMCNNKAFSNKQLYFDLRTLNK